LVAALSVKGAGRPKILGLRVAEPLIPAQSRSVSMPTTTWTSCNCAPHHGLGVSAGATADFKETVATVFEESASHERTSHDVGFDSRPCAVRNVGHFIVDRCVQVATIRSSFPPPLCLPEPVQSGLGNDEGLLLVGSSYLIRFKAGQGRRSVRQTGFRLFRLIQARAARPLHLRKSSLATSC
jgi:hypothetical protein